MCLRSYHIQICLLLEYKVQQYSTVKLHFLLRKKKKTEPYTFKLNQSTTLKASLEASCVIGKAMKPQTFPLGSPENCDTTMGSQPN